MLIFNLICSAVRLMSSRAHIAKMTDAEIDAVLERDAKASGLDLNWRESIVDLMKLLNIDSSIENRTRLWAEFKLEGTYTGSEPQNVLLIGEVRRRWADYELK